MSTYCFSALDDVPNRRNNKSYFLMNLYFTRFTVDFDIFRPFWSRILKIQSSIVHYRGFGVSSGLFFARQVATHDTPAGFDSQCRILSDAQIGALVVLLALLVKSKVTSTVVGPRYIHIANGQRLQQ